MTDFQFTEVTINGIADPVLARYERTSEEVAARFNINFQTITTIYNMAGTTSPTGGTPPALTEQDAQDVWNALNDLFLLAKNGMNGMYLNTEMARHLDELTRTFTAVGFPLPPATAGALLPFLQAWKDLTVLSPIISQVLAEGLDAYYNNRSLQALIELEYIKTANELVENKLGDLEEALGTTNNVLNIMSRIQDIHNILTVTSKPSFNFDYASTFGGNDAYVRSYQSRASLYFGTPIQVQIPEDIMFQTEILVPGLKLTFDPDVGIYYPSLGGFFVTVMRDTIITTLTAKGLSYLNELIRLRTSIADEIARLESILTPSQRAGAGNLYSQLKVVLADFDSILVDSGNNPLTALSTAQDKQAAFENWLIDKYNDTDSSASGAIQQNITKAISAAQALNDTQKESVRNYMFVFEEYYKSASAILQKITQILERIAQGIKG